MAEENMNEVNPMHMLSTNHRTELFIYSLSDFKIQALTHHSPSQFEELLCTKWRQAMVDGHFKYNLNNLETKILPGSGKYIVQLNEERFAERRKPQPIQSVRQAFDSSKFNFTKVKSEEIIFRMRLDNSDAVESVCLINVSPIAFGHSLLVPKPELHLNQQLNRESLNLSIHSILLTHSEYIRVAYNSLCAHASVNHLHLHIYYLNYHLAVETMKVRHLSGKCFELTEHPVGGYAWQVRAVVDIQSVIDDVLRVTAFLVEKNIGHNLFITRGVSYDDANISVIRLLLWPRKNFVGDLNSCTGETEGMNVNGDSTQVKTDNDYNIAVAELSGQIPVKRREKFESISEDEIIEAFNDVRLSPIDYDEVKKQISILVM